MEANSSPYLLIFRDSSPESYAAMSPEQRQQLSQQWNAWYEGLAAQGKLQHGHPLESKGRVVSGARGARVVDGPFAEAKEAIGGYFLLTVASLDEATEIARRCPNLRHGMIVEVRPVSEYCPLMRPLGRQAMGESTSAQAPEGDGHVVDRYVAGRRVERNVVGDGELFLTAEEMADGQGRLEAVVTADHEGRVGIALADAPVGQYAIVNICTDGGQGAVTLLQAAGR